MWCSMLYETCSIWKKIEGLEFPPLSLLLEALIAPSNSFVGSSPIPWSLRKCLLGHVVEDCRPPLRINLPCLVDDSTNFRRCGFIMAFGEGGSLDVHVRDEVECDLEWSFRLFRVWRFVQPLANCFASGYRISKVA